MGIMGSASAHLTRTDVVALWRCLVSTPAPVPQGVTHGTL